MHFSGNPVETEGTDANFRRIADFISLALLSKTLYEEYRVHTSSGCVSLASPICASSPAMDFHGSCISSVDRGSSLKEIKTLLGKLGNLLDSNSNPTSWPYSSIHPNCPHPSPCTPDQAFIDGN